VVRGVSRGEAGGLSVFCAFGPTPSVGRLFEGPESMVETAGCQAWYYGHRKDRSCGCPMWGSNDRGAQNAPPKHLDNIAGTGYNELLIAPICIYGPR
jgi:hypothetical protein